MMGWLPIELGLGLGGRFGIAGLSLKRKYTVSHSLLHLVLDLAAME